MGLRNSFINNKVPHIASIIIKAFGKKLNCNKASPEFPRSLIIIKLNSSSDQPTTE